MQLDTELLEKVAKNARLKLTEEEIKEFAPELKEILDAFSSLSQINTNDTAPSFHPLEIKNNTRDDNPKECIPPKQLLKNSKHKKGDYFLGPKAL